MADGMTASGRMMAIKAGICSRNRMIAVGRCVRVCVCVCGVRGGGGGLSYQCLIVFVLNCNYVGLPVAPLG